MESSFSCIYACLGRRLSKQWSWPRTQCSQRLASAHDKVLQGSHSSKPQDAEALALDCEALRRRLTSLAGPQHLSEGCIILPILPGWEKIPQSNLDLKVHRIPAFANHVSSTPAPMYHFEASPPDIALPELHAGHAWNSRTPVMRAVECCSVCSARPLLKSNFLRQLESLRLRCQSRLTSKSRARHTFSTGNTRWNQ